MFPWGGHILPMRRGIVFTARGRGGHKLQRGVALCLELEGGGTVFKPSVARGYLQCWHNRTVFKLEGQKCSEMVHVEKQSSPLLLAPDLINKFYVI